MAKTVPKSSGRKQAEAEVKDFARDLDAFVVAAETTRMAMAFADAAQPDNPIVFANDSFLALTGFDRAEVLGQSFNVMLASATESKSLPTIGIELSEHAEGGSKVRCRWRYRLPALWQ